MIVQRTEQVRLHFPDEQWRHKSFKEPPFCREHKTGNSKTTTTTPCQSRPTPAPSNYLEHRKKFYHCVWYPTVTGNWDDPRTFSRAAFVWPPPRPGSLQSIISLMPTLGFTLSNLLQRELSERASRGVQQASAWVGRDACPGLPRLRKGTLGSCIPLPRNCKS